MTELENKEQHEAERSELSEEELSNIRSSYESYIDFLNYTLASEEVTLMYEGIALLLTIKEMNKDWDGVSMFLTGMFYGAYTKGINIDSLLKYDSTTIVNAIGSFYPPPPLEE